MLTYLAGMQFGMTLVCADVVAAGAEEELVCMSDPCCRVLQSIAVCCSAAEEELVCMSSTVLHCVAEYCSVLQRRPPPKIHWCAVCYTMLQCIATPHTAEEERVLLCVYSLPLHISLRLLAVLRLYAVF